MMKLVNLRDERDVAIKLLDKWSFEAPSYTLMDQFRLSSTAIYPFQDGEDILLLRFSPEEERNKMVIQAELNFIEGLESRNIPVAKRIASKNGTYLVQSQVNGKDYYGSVFKRVKGQRGDRIDLTPSIVAEIGRTLAQIHGAQTEMMELAEHYKRPDYLEKLKWAQSLVKTHSEKDALLKEIEGITRALEGLTKSSQVYGLIQYDFELDNLFYHAESKTVSLIDFDDSHYHWYYMDIVNFLDNLDEEMDAHEVEALEAETLKKAFLHAYKEKLDVHEEIWENHALFKRYSNILGLADCLHSVSDLGSNPPEWMLKLKEKLEANIDRHIKNIL